MIAALIRALGVASAMLIFFRIFILLYWKNKINLSDISYVEARIWNSDIDKSRNFWGIPKFRYHFPAGFNKKMELK